MESLTLTNRDAIIALGEKISQQLVAGDVLVSDGDLGTDKTTFIKGPTAGLGIPDIIKSPIFTTIHEYQDGRLPLYRMDAYRLENGGVKNLGLEGYFDGDGASAVEWAESAEDESPVDFLTIHFKRTGDDNIRILGFEPHGQHFDQIVKGMVKQRQMTFR